MRTFGGGPVEENDVLGLDVAMHNVHGVQVGQGMRHLLEYHPGLGFVVPLLLEDGVEELGPLCVLQHQHQGLGVLEHALL